MRSSPPLLVLLLPLWLPTTFAAGHFHADIANEPEPISWQRSPRQPELLGVLPATSARDLAHLQLLPPSGMQRTSWPMTRLHATPLHSLSAHKRDPLGINARGFHEDVFHRDYGSFHPMRRRRSDQLTPREKRAAVIAPTAEHMTEAKRRPEMDAAGFYGDTFSNGLGEFWPLRKRWVPVKSTVDAWRKWYKRKPEMDSSGFFGDTFSNGFGDFWTMKKKNNQDIYKRKPEMDSAGFYGDTFSNGFGDFWTVKKKLEKRRPEMDSAGFYGDTFSNGFGDFWTVKKRSPGESEKQAEMENVSEASPSVQADESSIQ